MPEKMIYVIDDDKKMLDAIYSIFSQLEYQVSLYCDAEPFLDAHPDPEGVIILDLRLKGMSGLILQERMKHCTDCKIIFISGVAEVEDAVEGMKMGAFDFIVKPFKTQKIIDAVTRAFEVLTTDSKMRSAVARNKLVYQGLTETEKEVAIWICKGLRNKQIAFETGKSENTVKVQRSNIYRKLNVTSPLELAEFIRSLDQG